jgi:hypothetical protein
LVSKTIIIVLAVVLTATIVGIAVFFTQINPYPFLDKERYQVLTCASINMEPTITIGKKVLVDKQFSARDLKTDYPNSDIIVYYRCYGLVMSRVVGVNEANGTLVFRTKGDYNGTSKYPDLPSVAEYDPWEVPEDIILGKVVDTNY